MLTLEGPLSIAILSVLILEIQNYINDCFQKNNLLKCDAIIQKYTNREFFYYKQEKPEKYLSPDSKIERSTKIVFYIF